MVSLYVEPHSKEFIRSQYFKNSVCVSSFESMA